MYSDFKLSDQLAYIQHCSLFTEIEVWYCYFK